ncbi:hypothetical protein A2U01_0105563, partial [Trifolium medium]|nr:hypothetical protein [Trifolium medium]
PDTSRLARHSESWREQTERFQPPGESERALSLSDTLGSLSEHSSNRMNTKNKALTTTLAKRAHPEMGALLAGL